MYEHLHSTILVRHTQKENLGGSTLSFLIQVVFTATTIFVKRPEQCLTHSERDLSV